MMSAQERFTALFEANSAALLGYAVRRVVDPADAADVVAETFVVAWRRLDDVPLGEGARPWLFGVARNVLANFQRGDRRRWALADRLRVELVTAGSNRPDEGVHLALGRLGAEDQELLRLSVWDQLAHDEIALVLGISGGAVRVRLHRARRRLATAMTELGDEDSGPGGGLLPRVRALTVMHGEEV